MNAVLIAVVIMIVLCLCRLNVVISLFISALIGGWIAGLPFDKTITTFTENIVDGQK